MHWVNAGTSVTPNRWLMLGRIAVAHICPMVDGEQWLALVDRHHGPDGRRTSVAPDAETAQRWVDAWAERESPRLHAEAPLMRIGRCGWPEWTQPPD